MNTVVDMFWRGAEAGAWVSGFGIVCFIALTLLAAIVKVGRHYSEGLKK